MLQRNDGCRGRRAVCGFIQHEGEFGLRVLGMDQERRAAIHICAQQTEPLVGRIPRLDYYVVQLIAQELFHHSLKARLNLKEVRQHTNGSQATLHHS